MALRGKASAAVASNTTASVNVSSIGIQPGDIILALVAGGGGGTNTYTYPSGFVAVPGLANQANSQATQGIAYKVADGSETTTLAVVSSVTDFLTVQMRVYSGRNTASPFTAVAVSGNNFADSGVALTVGSVTAAAADDAVIFVASAAYDGSTSESYAPPTNFANGDCIFALAQFSPVIAACDWVNAPSGATGTAGGTITAVGRTGLTYCGFALSLAQGTSTLQTGASISQGQPGVGAHRYNFKSRRLATSIVTRAISGASATFAKGTLPPNLSIALVGNVATFAGGTLTSNNSPALLGAAATYTGGSLIPNAGLSIVGAAAAFIGGTLAADTGAGQSYALAGDASAFASGSPTGNLSIALGGVAAGFQTGVLVGVSVSSLTVALSGVAATFATGALTPYEFHLSAIDATALLFTPAYAK